MISLKLAAPTFLTRYALWGDFPQPPRLNLCDVLLVEAKNVGHGHTEAESQLRRQLPKVGWDESGLDLTDVGCDGAYAGLEVE